MYRNSRKQRVAVVKKFTVFSGFLGSGKTTTMMALTKYHTEHHGKAAMISNDLGNQNLADNKLAQLAGCNASELTGNCICYITETLVERLDKLFDQDGCELVISDIPGFGVGALDHVYHTLQRDYQGRYQLAPFTVLVEPRTVDILKNKQGGDLQYILNTQLLEADLIVLNKCDLLTAEEKEAALAWLKETYPEAKAIGISALTGDGLETLSQALMQGSASMHLPDIGYGGEEFGNAMGKMSEYYVQYYATVCCNDFDGNAYLMALAEAIQSGIREAGFEVPHLKLLAWEPEGDYGKADLLGIDRPVEVTKQFEKPCTELAVMLNASAACPSKILDGIMAEVVEKISAEYNLATMIFKKECFGMGG